MTKIEFIKTFIKKPAPVLICDTCAYLDIIRLPFRAKKPKNASDIIQSIQVFYDMLKEKKLYLLLPDIVEDEYITNSHNVIKELDNHLLKLNNDIAIYEIIAEKLFMTNNTNIIASENLKNNLSNTISKIHKKAKKIKREQKLSHLASSRMLECKPPAKKGKNSLADCYIYEFTISLAKEIRHIDTNATIGFLSSNVEDFGRSGHEPQNIQSDFTQYGISYFNHWAQATYNII